LDLYEYQARDLSASHSVPVLDGRTAATPGEAAGAASPIGGRVVVKAQVKAGGRSKAGGAKLATDPQDAGDKARDIFGLTIKGHDVRQVLVMEACDIAEEYYVSFLLDRTNRTFWLWRRPRAASSGRHPARPLCWQGK